MEQQRLEIDGWRAGLRFSACHILPEHPKCSRMHGHSYAVHVRLFGAPGEDGLILDFTRIKDIVRKIAEELDHRLLVPTKDPLIDLLVSDDSVKFRYGAKGYTIPIGDAVLLPLGAVSGEQLSRWLLKRLVDSLSPPGTIDRIELGVDEGPGQGAWSVWTPGPGDVGDGRGDESPSGGDGSGGVGPHD
jgi:6-pyruvoyltetrahydropterin/6-carboxytetrahydropterin synthase